MQDFYYTIMSSLGSETKFLYPVSVTQSISSMRTPNLPGKYIPGSSVIIIPFFSIVSLLGDTTGDSWISSPTP